MAEKSEVVSALMRSSPFKTRVRAIVASKAASVLSEATPDAEHLTWAKAAISSGYDAWVESLLILIETSPATVTAAVTAADSAYATALGTVFAQVVLAKV